MSSEPAGDIVRLPEVTASTTEIAIDELEHIYRFIYRRVGNRPDAEDLTQEVAMKAVPRLGPGAARHSIRAYLFATARTELARFWAMRFGLPEEELREDVTAARAVEASVDALTEQANATSAVSGILDHLPATYARVLELRFLHGYSTKEVAAELGSTVGAVRVMQLRALREAAKGSSND